jgi:hypothetical protein
MALLLKDFPGSLGYGMVEPPGRGWARMSETIMIPGLIFVLKELMLSSDAFF